MIKKILLLISIVGPFALYFIYSRITKSQKKVPTTKLFIISLILFILTLSFMRFYGGFDPNTKYSPAKYEDGQLKPAENK
tara:strand:- start:94 stop:333 length:240 start_codon:yes stop_codon:yes gene_type:complete